MEGIRVIMHPMNPGAGDVAVLCRHLLDCDENVQTQVVVHSPGLFLNLVLKNCITVVLLDQYQETGNDVSFSICWPETDFL